ncbi:hypothetical protein EZS27_025283 [termite gut metagenome]|uniref:Tetratricopeptide repeat protein n=1 Tax=termite gut metagenome TaxID=433724 RepID=A0A5J4QWN2_9ZZZZ
MTTASNLQQWVSSPKLLNGDTLYELRILLAHYPYCQTLRLLYVYNLYLLHDSSFDSELHKAALYVTDRRVLFYLIEQVEDVKSTSHADQTLELIDAFLSRLPQEDMPVHFDSVPNYTPYVLEEDTDNASSLNDSPKLHRSELIDDFIEKSKEKRLTLRPVDEKEPEEADPNVEEGNESYFTETLAKIYIKQKKYVKALEIIKSLHAKNPQKNAYFADQIRFLEKLIINTKS